MKLHKALAIVQGDVDNHIRKLVASERKHGLRPSCREGCSACCRLEVTSTLADSIGILGYLERHNPEAIAPLVQACIPLAKFAALPTTDAKLYHAAQNACPLLSNGRCSVYPVRPNMCRIHVSFSDPKLCADPNGVGAMLPASKIHQQLLPGLEQLMGMAKLPNPAATLTYSLLVAEFYRRNPTTWRRLEHTSAFDVRQSAGAWLHMEASHPGYQGMVQGVHQVLGFTPTVYPIWEEL